MQKEKSFLISLYLEDIVECLNAIDNCINTGEDIKDILQDIKDNNQKARSHLFMIMKGITLELEKE